MKISVAGGVLLAGLCFLAACSEEPKQTYKEPDWDRLTSADRNTSRSSPSADEAVVPDGSVAPASTNTPPSILEVTTTVEKSVRQGAITATAVAEDADGDPVELRYQWLINGDEDPFLHEATLPADSYAKNDQVRVRIVPFDGQVAGKSYLSPPLETPNVAPVITSQPPLSFQAHEYTYQVEAADPDDAQLSFALEDPPAGMTISAEGLINWPLTDVAPGDYVISITATDPEGNMAKQAFTLTLDKKVTSGA